MTKIIRSEDCGNSPKNSFIQEVAIALAMRNVEFLLRSVSDDIRWYIVGRKLVQGKAEFVDFIQSLGDHQIDTLTIHHVVTHGKAGSVNGIARLNDGGSQEFCDVWEFTNAKGTSVKAITSYMIEVG